MRRAVEESDLIPLGSQFCGRMHRLARQRDKGTIVAVDQRATLLVRYRAILVLGNFTICS